MKRILEETGTNAIESLMASGKRITFFHLNYIYCGVIIAIDGDRCLLNDPAIVYETGVFTEPGWSDAQSLPHPIWLNYTTCESFGEVK